MPSFGRQSIRNRDQCTQSLQRVLDEAIKHYDFTCIWGFRDREDQNTAFENGNSKFRWPFSKHNRKPSRAFDVVPYPKGFKATNLQFYLLATHILRAAVKVGVRIRWGGHWKMRDLAHFELEKEQA